MSTAKQGLVRTGWMVMDKGGMFPKGLYGSHSVAMRNTGRSSDYAIHVMVTEPSLGTLDNNPLDGWITEDGVTYMRKTRQGGMVEISLPKLTWCYMDWDGVVEEHSAPCHSLESLMLDIRCANGGWDREGGWANE